MAHIPRRRFSQNFLVDPVAIDAIIAAIGPQADDNIVEIGPGLGALTAPLAAAVRCLHVIEIDRDLVANLKRRFPSDKLVVHEGDALQFDFAALGRDLRVVGNLPYHISTPILFRLAEECPNLRDAHVMLQKEVVERMVAAAGSTAYGRLTVMLQYRFELDRILDVPARAFRPSPNVESAVVRLLPRSGGVRCADEAMLKRVVCAAFAQRRKTLRNTLHGYLEAADYAALQMNPGARAQELDVASFVRIADYLAARESATAAAAR